jgi:hypothetical protein
MSTSRPSSNRLIADNEQYAASAAAGEITAEYHLIHQVQQALNGGPNRVPMRGRTDHDEAAIKELEREFGDHLVEKSPHNEPTAIHFDTPKGEFNLKIDFANKEATLAGKTQGEVLETAKKQRLQQLEQLPSSPTVELQKACLTGDTDTFQRVIAQLYCHSPEEKLSALRSLGVVYPGKDGAVLATQSDDGGPALIIDHQGKVSAGFAYQLAENSRSPGEAVRIIDATPNFDYVLETIGAQLALSSRK